MVYRHDKPTQRASKPKPYWIRFSTFSVV